MILEADHLRVRYPNGALGILDVSVRVAAGQVVTLFGGNGAGKTTTVRAVSGFLRGEGARTISGKVSLFGTDVTNCEPQKVSRMGVGFVPERKKIFPTLSVKENLQALGKLPPRARREQAYAQVFELFPILAERRGEQAGRLSGGQQQMLAIARALLTEPQLLIVDEMTLGLHHSLQPPLFAVIKRIAAAGTAVVLVEESTGFALEVADYCYLIKGGTMVSEGPVERFKGSELLVAGYTDAS